MPFAPFGRKVVFAGSECPLCHKPVQPGQKFFASWGIFLRSDDPLLPYCDAAMHWDCYEKWKFRRRFGRAYVSLWVASEKRSRFAAKVYLDDLVFVQVNLPTPSVITLSLFETGTEYQMRLEDWPVLLGFPEPPLENLSALEREEVRRALLGLRKLVPTLDDLIRSIDWNAKEQLALQEEEVQERRRRQRMALNSPYNEACGRVQDRLRHSALTCPQCGHQSQDVRFIEKKNPEEKSYFRCKLCLGSFGPADEQGQELYGPIIGSPDGFPQKQTR
jgi:hypothetical protein